MLGAIVGDIVGSVFEFNNYKAKDFEPLFSSEARYTDDTICTVAVADALLNDKFPAECLREWGRRYWKNGSWGQKFINWLASDLSPAYNSYGNGSAMRVSPCAWIAQSHDQALQLATMVTEVTHNHPDGIKGAKAVTSAIYWAKCQTDNDEIRQMISELYGYDLSRSVDEIRLNNPHSEACEKSVPEAITCALESVSFEDAIRNAISIGGDSDTIAAICGSIAEAMYGVSDEITSSALRLLPDDMLGIIEQFNQTVGKANIEDL